MNEAEKKDARDLKDFHALVQDLGIDVTHFPGLRGPEKLRRFLSNLGVLKVPFERTCKCGYQFKSKEAPHGVLHTLCPECDDYNMWIWGDEWLRILIVEEDREKEVILAPGSRHVYTRSGLARVGDCLYDPEDLAAYVLTAIGHEYVLCHVLTCGDGPGYAEDGGGTWQYRNECKMLSSHCQDLVLWSTEFPDRKPPEDGAAAPYVRRKEGEK